MFNLRRTTYQIHPWNGWYSARVYNSLYASYLVATVNKVEGRILEAIDLYVHQLYLDSRHLKGSDTV